MECSSSQQGLTAWSPQMAEEPVNFLYVLPGGGIRKYVRRKYIPAPLDIPGYYFGRTRIFFPDA